MLHAVCQLVRLPNVGTAVADVLMGYWIVQANSMDGRLACLVGASVCLYWTGMVLNDVFDRELDRVERPERPIPSGTVSLRFAVSLAVGLAGVGLAWAAAAGRPALLTATLLGLAILAYDGLFKDRIVGPPMMGICRLLNVILGMSAACAVAGSLPASASLLWLVPLGNGIYVSGVTWFARQEAGISDSRHLAASGLVMALGLGTHGFVLAAMGATPIAAIGLGLLASVLAGRLVCAIREPSPRRVQRAVKWAVLGLVPLDAVLVLAFRGPGHALLVLALLAPALVTGRRLAST